MSGFSGDPRPGGPRNYAGQPPNSVLDRSAGGGVSRRGGPFGTAQVWAATADLHA
jgi:hypothetical protein